MSIRDSSKLRHVLGALAVVALIYAALDVPLRRLAIWAETSADSYPWGDEDYLRYLLPTLFDGNGGSRLLIAGPSEAREDLLYEQFNRAFPGTDTYQGGIGGGAFQDLLAGLEYIRLEHGTEALPTGIVLGITPRFIGNIPRRPAPVVESITRYSPHWNAVDSPTGPVLERKTALEGLVARFSFQFKQQARYKSAICTAALHMMNGGRMPELPEGGARSGDGRLAHLGDELEWRLYFCRAPYRYHGLRVKGTPEGARSWLTSPRSFWPRVHAWDPYSERAMIEAQLGRIVQFTRDHDIALYVVNLPEHPENQAQYRPGHHDRYMEIVRAVIGDTPFLDLRDMLGPDDYLDHAHADLAAARRVTARTIEFIRAAAPERRDLELIVRPDDGVKAPEGS